MIWYMYALQNGLHNKSIKSNKSIITTFHHMKLQFFFLVMGTFKIYFLSNFQIPNSVIDCCPMPYITSNGLFSL